MAFKGKEVTLIIYKGTGNRMAKYQMIYKTIQTTLRNITTIL